MNTENIADKDADQIGILDMALALAENFRSLVLVPLAVGAIALGISFLLPPTYVATTRILPPAQQQSASAALAAQFGSLAGLVGGAAGVKSPADQYVSLLKSNRIYDAIIERFKLKDLYGVQYGQDARKLLENKVKIVTGLKDGIISIEMQDRDPVRAANIANGFVEEFRNLTNSLAISEAAQRRLFFETQLTQAKINLTKAEIALRGSGVSEAVLRTVPQSALEALARLKAQISLQEIKLSAMRTFMTESNPEMKMALQELAGVRGELQKAEGTNSSKATGEGAEYIARYRDFKYNETLFELISKQYEAARLDEARQGAVIQVIDAAQPPERRSKPHRSFIAIVTTLVVFFLMVFFILVRRMVFNLALEPESAAKWGRLRQLFRLPKHQHKSDG